ncbi:MAG: hypothetical protein V4556_05300 [Bacteroidota bacterium]
MKKVSYKTKLVSLAIAVIFSTSFTTNANAGTLYDGPLPLSLKYIGVEKNFPAFKLSMFNAEESQFTIELYDQHNIVLYNEVVQGNSVSKKFLLDVFDLKDAVLTFKVTGTKTGEYSIYEIDCSTLTNKNWSAKKIH